MVCWWVIAGGVGCGYNFKFLVSMIIVTYAVMLACVCMYVCVCVCVCVCVSWRLLVNTISQEGKLGQISYLVCRCTTLSTRTLLFLVEVKGHLGSTGVKLWKHCKNLVNMISQQGKLGQISYLVCMCTTLSTRTLLFLVEVKGHLGSTGVKLWKPCKHDISRREASTDLIFGMLVYHNKYKKYIVFGGCQRSFEVNKGWIVNTFGTLSQKNTNFSSSKSQLHFCILVEHLLTSLQSAEEKQFHFWSIQDHGVISKTGMQSYCIIVANLC